MIFNRFLGIVLLTTIQGISVNSSVSDNHSYISAQVGCEVPQVILDKIKTGVQFALDNKAAFVINNDDLNHVHLLISHLYYAEFKKDKLSNQELMLRSEALLFHSLEIPHYRNKFSEETRKRRNIFYDLLNGKLQILDVDYYPVDTEYYTIWPESDLGYKETFQISFYQISPDKNPFCKYPSFEVSIGKVTVTHILREI